MPCGIRSGFEIYEWLPGSIWNVGSYLAWADCTPVNLVAEKREETGDTGAPAPALGGQAGLLLLILLLLLLLLLQLLLPSLSLQLFPLLLLSLLLPFLFLLPFSLLCQLQLGVALRCVHELIFLLLLLLLLVFVSTALTPRVFFWEDQLFRRVLRPKDLLSNAAAKVLLAQAGDVEDGFAEAGNPVRDTDARANCCTAMENVIKLFLSIISCSVSSPFLLGQHAT